MSRFKDFGNPFDVEKAEKVSFKLYGEEFSCRAELQGKSLLEFAAMSDSDNPADSSNAILKFFSEVLLPESYERFNALANDPDKIISVTTLGEIVEWLVGEYTNRPQQGPELSPTGE